ncbi:hypothetical protein QFZ40_001438 [Arthrobacter pascens]|uniref:hypothetical protein n=1 Tax=Arthrobacter pascens TaxID=1677 RepID=UPI0027860268|nr:hypothetical protein [Arthrobacter pascens]
MTDVHTTVLAALRNRIRVLQLHALVNPGPVLFMCLIAVLLASTFAVVAPVTMRTSISFHHRQTRAPEPVRFRLRGLFYQGLHSVFRGRRIGEGSRGEQRPELLLDQPGSLQFPSGVVGVEHGTEPVPGPIRKRVPGPE